MRFADTKALLVSYDINKDGYRIAVLTLVKSAYRLGDTVNVMISMNQGAARVLRVYTALPFAYCLISFAYDFYFCIHSSQLAWKRTN